MASTSKTNIRQTLCAMLIAERKKAGLTQVEVAERLNRPQSYVQKVETKERRLDVVDLIALAHAIGFDPSKFVRELSKSLDD